MPERCDSIQCLRLLVERPEGSHCDILIVTTRPLPEAPLNQFDQICLCDDVNGDGSNIVPFVRVIEYVEGGTVQIFGDFTPDYSAPYSATNPVDCNSIGSPTNSGIRGLDVPPSQVWASLPVTAESVTVIARTIGNPATPPTITTDAGTVSLILGQPYTWRKAESAVFLNGTFSVTTGAGDNVSVIWTEVSA